MQGGLKIIYGTRLSHKTNRDQRTDAQDQGTENHDFISFALSLKPCVSSGFMI
jgi:hypothetical protein